MTRPRKDPWDVHADEYTAEDQEFLQRVQAYKEKYGVRFPGFIALFRIAKSMYKENKTELQINQRMK